MSFSLVHLGHGETALLESPDFIDPTIALPKARQHTAQRAKERYDRIEALRYALAQEASQRRSYGPVSLLEAMGDQCRYIGHQETTLCCGKKVTNPGSSWCEVHHAIVFSRRQTSCGNTVDYGHKPHFFSKA